MQGDLQQRLVMSVFPYPSAGATVHAFHRKATHHSSRVLDGSVMRIRFSKVPVLWGGGGADGKGERGTASPGGRVYALRGAAPGVPGRGTPFPGSGLRPGTPSVWFPVQTGREGCLYCSCGFPHPRHPDRRSLMDDICTLYWMGNEMRWPVGGHGTERRGEGQNGRDP